MTLSWLKYKTKKKKKKKKENDSKQRSSMIVETSTKKRKRKEGFRPVCEKCFSGGGLYSLLSPIKHGSAEKGQIQNGHGLKIAART